LLDELLLCSLVFTQKRLVLCMHLEFGVCQAGQLNRQDNCAAVVMVHACMAHQDVSFKSDHLLQQHQLKKGESSGTLTMTKDQNMFGM